MAEAEQNQLNLFAEGLVQDRPASDGQQIDQPREFRFIDLFAGIGGFRIGLQKVGGQCVFSCEWDRYSRKTYEAWFGEAPFGDIRDLNLADVPDHDILAGGFPCQPFSLAGVSKKNSLGRAHGFLDETQGTLFFEVVKIIAAKRPAAVFLENVKNLRSHDGGRTWQVIQRTLEELGYWVFSKVVDAAGWVPQHRERVYIICFDKARYPQRPDFWFPAAPKIAQRFAGILEPDPAAVQFDGAAVRPALSARKPMATLTHVSSLIGKGLPHLPGRETRTAPSGRRQPLRRES